MVDRIIDPRLGAASYQKSEGSSNIIDDLADEGLPVNPAESWTSRQACRRLITYWHGIGVGRWDWIITPS